MYKLITNIIKNNKKNKIKEEREKSVVKLYNKIEFFSESLFFLKF